MKIANLNPEYTAQLAGGITLGSPTSGDVSGGLPGALTVVGLDGIAFSGSPANTDLIQYNGSNWVFVTPASLGIGTGLYVEEVDGSPSVAATEIDVPNGSLGVVGTVATMQYAQRINGGGDTLKTHGNMGSTETFDPADGNWHTGTFNAACTFTFTAPASGVGASLILELAQDGTGGHAMTLPGSFVNKAALEAAQVTTLSTTSFLIVWTRDGGTTWYGGWQGSGATLGTATPLVESGAGTAGTAVSASHEDHVHPLSSTGGGVLLIADSHSTPLVFGDILQTEAGDDFLYSG